MWGVPTIAIHNKEAHTVRAPTDEYTTPAVVRSGATAG
jgi:hypothetical protein